MNTNYVWVAVVVVAIIATVGLFTPAGQSVVEKVTERNIGSVAGPDMYNLFRPHSGVVRGGLVTSSSTAGTASTMLASALYNPSVDQMISRYEIQPTGGNLTLTLPASSTMGHIAPDNGDVFSFVVENEATAATNTTIAAGAGMDLQEPDGQNVVIGQNNYAWVHMMRDENGDFIVWVDESIPAD